MKTNSGTIFNYADGSVTISGRHYSAEEYKKLCDRVWAQLNKPNSEAKKENQ